MSESLTNDIPFPFSRKHQKLFRTSDFQGFSRGDGDSGHMQPSEHAKTRSSTSLHTEALFFTSHLHEKSVKLLVRRSLIQAFNQVHLLSRLTRLGFSCCGSACHWIGCIDLLVKTERQLKQKLSIARIIYFL